MANIIWLTDIHLNFLNFQQNSLFLRKVLQHVQPGDYVVITGDISEAPSVREFMVAYDGHISKAGGKLYFVLGNHDYYSSSIKSVQEGCEDLLGHCYLPAVKIAKLSDTTALVGHDGMWDGLYANYFQSKLDMSDYHCITELSGVQCIDKRERFTKLNELAQKAADHVYLYATEAAKTYKHVIIATHVPPFRENSVYNGKISDDTWLPHFSSKRMGDTLLRLAEENREVEFTVLCGHSHGHAVHKAATNMVCYTGSAEYNNPKVSMLFRVE